MNQGKRGPNGGVIDVDDPEERFPATFKKLRPPYRDTYDLRLDIRHVEALRSLLRWVDPDSTRKRRRDPEQREFYKRLAEIQEAIKDA